ncbi:MAG: phosphoribosylformylglycinamidine synthase I [Candidatus Gracilibacteria bacterium]|jgi:phosphoribosylformylglycinamidine synthase
MAKPKVLVITGYGINCEEETAKAFVMAGGESKIMHINDIITAPRVLDEYQIMAFPGGFSYGDDTGSGNAMANKITNNMKDHLLDFVKKDKLVAGICNGFQILVNLGLLPATDKNYGIRQAALMPNKSARYQCRWVYLKKEHDNCVWTKGIDFIHLPVAHGEGNFYVEEDVLKKMKANKQIIFKSVKEDGSPSNGEFPFSPNGALEDIAGICDPTGKILGMMPHPERFNAFTNEDGWEIKKEKLLREGKPLPKEGEGIKIFRNAIKYFE